VVLAELDGHGQINDRGRLKSQRYWHRVSNQRHICRLLTDLESQPVIMNRPRQPCVKLRLDACAYLTVEHVSI
jgi:hypothetical protein